MAEYMTFEGRHPVEVRCKGECTTVTMTRLPGNGGLLTKTTDYAELVIAMREANGLFGKHETGVCHSCKARILNDGPQPGELEAIYAQDIEQWMSSAVRMGSTAAEALLMADRFISRTPIRALDEKGRGEI